MTGAQFITDDKGNRTAVVLSIEDYRKILEALKELESIRDCNTAAEDVTTKPSKWALLAQDIEKNSPIKGIGKELLSSVAEFRANFAFKHDESD